MHGHRHVGLDARHRRRARRGWPRRRPRRATLDQASCPERVPARPGRRSASRAEQLVGADDRPRRRSTPRSTALQGARARPRWATGSSSALQTRARAGAGRTRRAARRLPAAIVLLSDGASSAARTRSTSPTQAKKLKIPIYTVALGHARTACSTPTRTGRVDRAGAAGHADAAGHRARRPAGASSPRRRAARLEAIYANLGTRFSTKKEKQEVTSAFAGGALVLLLAGAVLGAAARWGGCREPPARDAPAARPAAARSARPSGPAPGPIPPAVLRSLDLAVMRRVESLVPGEHLTPQVGGGTELAMIRPVPARRRRAPHRLERDRAHAASRTCACTSASAR